MALSMLLFSLRLLAGCRVLGDVERDDVFLFSDDDSMMMKLCVEERWVEMTVSDHYPTC